MPTDDLFKFEPSTVSQEAYRPWKVLSVEDDPVYQASLVHALSCIRVAGRPLEVICTQSALDAARVLPEHADIALILLDVVMESDDAGLRLVSTIRDVIGNNQVRIVLLTGQPGMTPPRQDLLEHFEIDDYWCKSELTHEHLLSVITGNLRVWERTAQLEKARQGLQLIVDASQALSKRRDLDSYTQTVLSSLLKLLNIDTGGLICRLRFSPSVHQNTTYTLAACGAFQHLKGHTLDRLEDQDLQQLCSIAISQRQHLYLEHYTLLYFPADNDKTDDYAGSNKTDDYLVLVKTDRQLTSPEVSMLEVFCENINNGFTNLSLYNRLTRIAYQDSLLNIPNRNYLKRTLRALSPSTLCQHQLLVISLDNLNEVALYFGESFCNSTLKSVHRHLQASITEQLLLARIDRHVFAILIPENTSHSLHDFSTILPEPLLIDGGEHQISYATALLPLSGCDTREPEQILRLAELSVESARHDGKRFIEYDDSQQQVMRQRYHMLDELRKALQAEALSIALQPKVDIVTGAAVGFEALVRWQQDDGSMTPPSEFIPVAEAAGLISELDLFVLKKTLEAAHQLIQAGLRLPISFNTSSNDLLRPGYFDEMLKMVTASGLPFNLLELEVTETQAMIEYQHIATQLRKLLQLGMKVSIDDFGTGYSSLAHITELAASTLKIDQTFVARLGQSEGANHIIEMIMRLSDRFGFHVVAEGVETEQQRQLLIAKGCVVCQGYLFAKPMPVAQALEWAQHHILNP
ncbi:GGDEF/EAL domain-containing response regulator [Marinobacterium iners]|uniref:EAL domain, c-di-GMP-specific phosphodiesterase class I (Or its enzymatically inactive variant) n=1 Tax=Marinobacterium iners DSM 11526 TaxID=1122198 RepID=A0A1H4DIZ6_9GAMM|nr:EAL domain-containing protein [Marinobacterium iners]SEA72459.1 EAL domain, c-di-GMP-specific phosphodiesterase class I (or its enzymatically inactive variant) [Marinobacterium iners DSM 11526]